jgi:hypothetical protein
MPFTLAHAAAALPIWIASGRRLRPEAIAIGCLTPDYEYFVTLYPRSWLGHTPLGLLVICLPAGWLTLGLFDRYGRAGIERLLPPGWRLPSRSPRELDTVLGRCVALLLGAASHVLWDSFTHGGAAGVRFVPVLGSAIRVAGLDVPWFKLLQHGSTIGGSLALGAIALRWAVAQPRVPLADLLRCALPVLAVLLAIAVLNGARFAPIGFHSFLVGGGVAVALAVISGPVLLGIATRGSGRRPAAGS